MNDLLLMNAHGVLNQPPPPAPAKSAVAVCRSREIAAECSQRPGFSGRGQLPQLLRVAVLRAFRAHPVNEGGVTVTSPHRSQGAQVPGGQASASITGTRGSCPGGTGCGRGWSAWAAGRSGWGCGCYGGDHRGSERNW